MRLNPPVLKSNAMQMEGKGTKIRLQNDITDLKDIYSCPCLVVEYTEELISRTFLGEIQFRLVSQDRVRSQNGIGCLVFVSRSLFV